MFVDFPQDAIWICIAVTGPEGSMLSLGIVLSATAFSPYSPATQLSILAARARRAHAFTPRIGRVDVRPDPHAAGGHVLRVELPGFTKEETAVEVREDLLTITAEHGLADEAKGGEKATDKGKQKAEADDAYVQVDAQAKNDNADEDHAMDEHQDADADEDAELPSPHVRVQRSWTLPEGIDASAIKAEQEHGVLTVTIPAPKAKEEPAPVRVPIA